MDNETNALDNYLLDCVNAPQAVKQMDSRQLAILAQEIRDFLIENVSLTGGHLASNLGVVELTLALHKVFNTPEDKIVWDVGHQSYVHKIITGRRGSFCTLRQFKGLSGFPKVSESLHDCFNTGHSSTSISAALGMARARDIKNEKNSVIAVIGDGALSGGLAFEALNDAGRSPNDLIVILNDNEMSISRNVGGLSRYLSKIRSQPIYSKAKEEMDGILARIPAIGKSAAKALETAKDAIKYLIMPGMIFEELGFKYLGPIDGHNINELIEVLNNAKRQKGPILIHVCTQKGRGYSFAEEHPDDFHGISPFEIQTGELKSDKKMSFSDVFGKKLVELAEKDSAIIAITAAMKHGTGLNDFSRQFPGRFFDVGIAEQHAVTFAAGLAQSGLRPVVAIYSSFLQRAYDQILHDVALQNLKVVFAIDRAGIVGEDGETHQGIYDLSFLRHIPNMTIMSPSDFRELELMLEYGTSQDRGPVAIRYPRGATSFSAGIDAPVEYGKAVRIAEGSDVSIIAEGDMLETAVKAAELLKSGGIAAEVIYARFIKPLDVNTISSSARKTGLVVTLEDNTAAGGFGSGVLEMLCEENIKADMIITGFPDTPIEHGSRDQLFRRFGMDARSIADDIINRLKAAKERNHG
jgi:1-deoxy-D-xylulose-5-phosphate synthase